MLLSLDIETACAVGCKERCDHALDEYRNRITVIGTYFYDGVIPHARCFRSIEHLSHYLSGLGNYRLVGHNLKFDLRVLTAHGLDLSAHWEDDTLLMAATLLEKVSPDWMAWYERERARLNALLPRGSSHRVASQHSLKCLAPYFLKVAPFWENPSNHDNDEYVLKDCEYTYRLAELLSAKLKEQGSYEFYKEKLLPWTRMLLKMEERGVALDLAELEKRDEESKQASTIARISLDRHWKDAYADYRALELKELRNEYDTKALAAIQKAKDSIKTKARYDSLYEKAAQKVPEKMNLDSPAQLSWILKDHLSLDIKDFHGDETTGKGTLQRHASRPDIKQFLEYRKHSKLVSAFFPSYREMNTNGVLHCSFNPTGTRTGRLSSSKPNLQQVPGHLHSLFRARPGYRLATFDMSAIEPRLIAFFTNDLVLFDLVNSGQDFHGYNAKVFFELPCEVAEVKERYPNERKMAKEVGLSLFYGAGSGRLRETSIKYGFHWTENQCRHVLKRFKEAYEGVYDFRDSTLNPILMSGRCMENILGRPVAIEDPSDVHMQGFNTLVQGSASDLVLESAHRITERFASANIDGHVLLLVHDEIVTEVAEESEERAVAIIKDCMTNYPLHTPLGLVKLEVEGKVGAVWTK